jgi:tetratricopeptide (TPR) repeat protein
LLSQAQCQGLVGDSSRRLLAADSDSIEAHIYLGEVEFRQSKWDEALQEYRAAYEINPDLYGVAQFLCGAPNAVRDVCEHRQARAGS